MAEKLKKDKTSKVRYFSLVTYASKTSLLDVLNRKLQQIRAYAFILHDNDEGKNPHYHLVIVTYHARSYDDILSWFDDCTDVLGLRCNSFIKPVFDLPSCYDYLTHKNAPDKYQYSSDDIVSFNEAFFKTDVVPDTLSLAIEDLLNGTSLNECRKRYGRDFIVHYGHIKTLLTDIVSETMSQNE